MPAVLQIGFAFGIKLRKALCCRIVPVFDQSLGIQEEVHRTADKRSCLPEIFQHHVCIAFDLGLRSADRSFRTKPECGVIAVVGAHQTDLCSEDAAAEYSNFFIVHIYSLLVI